MSVDFLASYEKATAQPLPPTVNGHRFQARKWPLVRAILEQHQAGASAADIVMATGANLQFVYNVLRSFDLSRDARPHAPHSFKTEQLQEIAHSYASGLPITRVAAKHNVSAGTVRRALLVCNVPPRPASLPYHQRNIERQEKIVAFHDGGKRSMQEVGNHFGITRERVRQILIRAGVDVRAHDQKAIERERIVREAEALFSQGASLRSAAQQLRIAERALADYCRRAGVSLERRNERWDRLRSRGAEMAALYAAGGMTQAQIAEKYGVAHTTVARACVMNGIVDPRRRRRSKDAA